MTIAISMVTLNAEPHVSIDEIAKSWRKRWSESVISSGSEDETHTLSLRVGACEVIYGLMPAPIPWSELESLCAASGIWPEASEVLKKHTNHVIVTVIGEGNHLAKMIVLTKATVAFADACSAANGIYWGNSSQVFPPGLLASIAGDSLPDDLPVPIWVNVCVAENEDGTTAGFTKGLAAFDLKEFEALKSPEPSEELYNRLLGLCEYLIRNGAVIKDRDTIGESATERIRIVYGISEFGSPTDVMRLEYGNDSSIGAMTTYGCIHATMTLLCTIAFGYALYAKTAILQGSFIRHFLFIPATLIFGFLLLMITDRFFEKTFGLQAFAKPVPKDGATAPSKA